MPSATPRTALRRVSRAAAATFAGLLIMAIAGTAPAFGEPPAVTAGFGFEPDHPYTYQSITFESTSVASGEDALGTPNAIASESWDFNQDGLYERTGSTIVNVFGGSGDRVVHLHVTDTNGNADDYFGTVPVRNRSPEASVVYAPASPHTGEAITFFSTSTDRDGRIDSEAWDLDGDGKYNDGSGQVATGAFAAPGTYTVRLRVTDNLDASDSVTIKVVVVGQASRSGGGSPASPLAFGAQILSPFPIVRISGLVRKRGVRLRLLTIDAPLGSTVSIRCRGHGCPFGRRSRHVKPSAGAAALPGAHRVRIRRLGHRLLRPGTTLKVFVTKRDTIGKYTRLKVRRRKLPARVDRCLLPNTKQPMRCPGA